MSERSRRQGNSADAEQQEGAGVNNAIRPNYYQMPNGVEVSAITDYLTFNGGNAVKYVARSSRVDGVIKSDKIEDLCKAGHYIARELAVATADLDGDDPKWESVDSLLSVMKRLLD